jgi:inosine triphosphate pyrophosphatase
MKDLVFITGNQSKADYLAKWLGVPIPHQKVELEELQSLDLREVTEDKARRAYAVVQKPVLVEDVALTFHALGRLPGTYIKWFLEELGVNGLCKILQGYDDRSATASIMYGLYDGETFRTFEAHMPGKIAPKPESFDKDNGWKNSLSWNAVFIPDGADRTYAAMSDEELKSFSHRAQAIAKLREFQTSQ